MKNLLVMFLFAVVSLVCFVGCTANTESDAPTVQGNWIYVNQSGTRGVGLSLNGDGTYVASLLQLTSETTALVQLENGTYVSTNNTLTFTSAESTCPDANAETVTYKYTLNNGGLQVMFPQGIINLERNNSQSDSSFILTFGCFRDGKFERSELAPVQ